MLRRWAAERPSHPALVSLEHGEQRTLTYQELDARARAVAAAIAAHVPVGARVLLMFPQCADFVTAFFGCWYAGVTPVPVAPPDPTRLERTLPRVLSVAKDADPALVLGTSMIVDLAPALLPDDSPLRALTWLAVDALPAVSDDAIRGQRGSDLALLQYTSGSTGDPKGVVVTHENMTANIKMFSAVFGIDQDARFVSWLPQFHDMGLIGSTLGPLSHGATLVSCSPFDFLKRPRVWLELLSEHKGTHSGSPNFGFDLCVRKVTGDALQGLDLSSWHCAWNGAEPIRFSTLDRFARHFAPAGFRAEAFLPCYGLAEGTLFVTGDRLTGKSLAPLRASIQALGQGRYAPPDNDDDSTELVSLGVPQPESRVAIVSRAGEELPAGVIGEVWNAGPHVAQGYRGRGSEGFDGRLAGDAASFLRTGDLGFVRDGHLYVTGRVKDLIVVRGVNLFPADIEDTVAQASPHVRPGCVAAVGVEGEAGESLVVIAEVERRFHDRRGETPRAVLTEEQRRRDRRDDELMPHRAPWPPTTAEITASIRAAVVRAWGVTPEVVLIVPGNLPKTTSGKVQRLEARRQLLSNELPVLAEGEVPGHRG